MNENRTVLMVVSLIMFLIAPAYGLVMAQTAVQSILAVHVDQILNPISPYLRGANQRYVSCGSYAWDCPTDAPVAAVVAGARATGITFLRFPGGTVSSTYLWTNGIGPVSARPIGISGNGMPTTNEYGFDEHMALCAAIGARTTVVVNFGLGTAQEAAAWVAYANGSPTDPRPIGIDRMGRDWKTVGYWARLREDNQRARGVSPHPYAVHYWEVGNELYGKWELSWTHDPVQYAFGGVDTHSAEPVVQHADWRPRASASDGAPNQVFYLRYPPVIPGTVHITVAGTEWRAVDDLDTAGPDDRVYVIDPRTGRIEFGDGHHGSIPPRGARISATYTSGPHDGFVDFYAAMKAVDPTIAVGSCFNGDTFLRAMGTAHRYDFVVVHLYTGAPRRTTALTAMGAWAMAVPQMFAARLKQVRGMIDEYAGSRAAAIPIIITEYNPLLRFRQAQLEINDLSLAQALDVADLLRIFAEQSIPVAAIHCLTSRGGTTLFAPPPDYTRRPAAYAIEMFSYLAPEQVATNLTGVGSYRFTYRGTDYQIPYLTALASYDPAAGRVTILVIDKHPDASSSVRIIVTGFDPAVDGTIYTLTGPALSATDTAANPNEVAINRTAITTAGPSFVYHFPAHSVTIIELQQRAAAR